MQRFSSPASTVLNAAGTGTAVVTAPSGVTWRVELLSVSTNTATAIGTPQSKAEVFYGAQPQPVNFIEETFLGDGDSSDSRYTLLGGESVCVQWTGGTAGALATMVVRGEQIQVGA